MIAWYRSPYEIDPWWDGRGRLLSFSRLFNDQILFEGGGWSETEIAGNQALIKVRASAALHAAIAKALPVVHDLASAYTPTRFKPTLRGGEVMFTTQAVACKPWQWADREVLSDLEYDAVRRKRDALIREADRAGKHIFTPVDDFEKMHLLSLLGRAGYGLDRVSTGTFPTTSVVTNFTGADEAPLSEGGAWSGPTVTGWNTCRRVSNACQRTAVGIDGMAYRVGATSGADCESGFDISNTTGSGYAYLRIANPGSALATDGYLSGYNIGVNAQSYRLDNDSFTAIGSAVAYSPGAGDGFGNEMISTTLAIYKRVSGTWSSLTSTTDATYSAAGVIGVQIQTSSGVLDNYFGGVIVTTRTVSVNDSVTVTESVTMNVKLMPNQNDAVSIAESVSVNVVNMPQVNDAVSVSEAVTMNVLLNPQVNDAVTVAESVALNVHLMPTVEDSLTVADALTVNVVNMPSVSDDVSVAESVNVNCLLNPQVSDDVTVTEVVSVYLGLNITVDETVTVVDSLTVIVGEATLRPRRLLVLGVGR